MIHFLLAAFQICWTGPTHYVPQYDEETGEIIESRALEPGAVQYYTAYYGNVQPGQWDRTMQIEATGSGCANIRVSRGVWYVALTATVMSSYSGQLETSAHSRWVRKEENRLAGPRGGRLIGPTDGRLLTE